MSVILCELNYKEFFNISNISSSFKGAQAFSSPSFHVPPLISLFSWLQQYRFVRLLCRIRQLEGQRFLCIYLAPEPHADQRTEASPQNGTKKQRLFGDPPISPSGFSLVRPEQGKRRNVDQKQISYLFRFPVLSDPLISSW